MAGTYEQAEANNQALWDEIAPVHFRAYPEVDILREGGIVLDQLEMDALAPVEGKTLLHLQCHIGTDTLSWARLGATVTGVDFSGQSIRYARMLQEELELEATFVEASVYDLPKALEGEFDFVYTSRGVLCWLRDLNAWAQVIALFLKPGGIFYILETHPILNALEETQPGELGFVHPYFHRPEPAKWDDDDPDYADSSYVSQHPSYEWDWTISDILTALLKAGLTIESFSEHDRLFWKRFPSMEPCAKRWYHHPNYTGKLPLLFALTARKASER